MNIAIQSLGHMIKISIGIKQHVHIHQKGKMREHMLMEQMAYIDIHVLSVDMWMKKNRKAF